MGKAAGKNFRDGAVRPQMNESDDVHVGEEGWLFLTGGQNRPLAMYGRSLAHAILLLRWSTVIRMRAARCRRLGIAYVHLPVPEKLSVYADKAPGLGIDPSRAFASRLCLLLGRHGPALDVAPALTAWRPAGETFLRTDSHWSSEGGRAGHDAICAAVGARLRWDMADREILRADHFVGDLGSKLTPPLGEALVRPLVTRDARRIGANEMVLRYEHTEKLAELHRGTSVVLRNDAPDADPRRLVLFGDSYAHFAAHGLTAMLGETFREVHFLWSSSIDWAHVERIAPDILVTQIAERFMMKLPRDDIYDNAAFAAERLREMEGEPA